MKKIKQTTITQEDLDKVVARVDRKMNIVIIWSCIVAAILLVVWGVAMGEMKDSLGEEIQPLVQKTNVNAIDIGGVAQDVNALYKNQQMIAAVLEDLSRAVIVLSGGNATRTIVEN